VFVTIILIPLSTAIGKYIPLHTRVKPNRQRHTGPCPKPIAITNTSTQIPDTPTPRPKISKTREEGRQKREEELEEDWEGQALVSAPSPSAPDAMAVTNFCDIGHLGGGAAAVSNSRSAIYRRLERIWKGAALAPAVRTGRGRGREEWLRAAAAQMENGRGRGGEKSSTQRGVVAAETECLSMGRAEGTDRSPLTRKDIWAGWWAGPFLVSCPSSFLLFFFFFFFFLFLFFFFSFLCAAPLKFLIIIWRCLASPYDRLGVA
jgi:hypothetical protein